MSLSRYNHIISFLIFILLINSSLSDPCLYKETRAQTAINSTDVGTYLKTTSSEISKQQKCFSLSDSDVFPHKCCYDTSQKKCVKEATTTNANVVCPKDTTIENNCGMAGFYQPVTSERCTEISLVDGYCCFLKLKSNDTACVRRKELNDDNKKDVSDDVKIYVKSRGYDPNDIDDSSFVCEGNLLKIKFYFYLFFLFAIYVI